MDKNTKEKWVEALRSGRYRQGREFLRRMDDSFCCLGVLCDIVDPESWEWEEPAEPTAKAYYLHRFAGIMPTVPVLQEVDLTPARAYQLAGMNDKGMSFEDIARYIEENL